MVRLKVMLYRGSFTMHLSPVRAKLFADVPTGYASTVSIVTATIIIHWLLQRVDRSPEPGGVDIDFLLRVVVDIIFSDDDCYCSRSGSRDLF